MKNLPFKIRSVKKGALAPFIEYIPRLGPYSEKRDLIASGCGNLPHWASSPATFFLASEELERKNAAVAREIIVLLDNRLTREQAIRVVEEGIRQDLSDKTFLYGIHTRGGLHVHILYSDRINDDYQRSRGQHFRRWNGKSPELGGCKKDSGGQPRWLLAVNLAKRRKVWEQVQSPQPEVSGLAKTRNSGGAHGDES